MRRADRLFEIIQVLRRRKKATAAEIATALEVSPRTVYRDVRDLMARGVPIDGEAGVGYVLRPGFLLPPLMFDVTEIEALLLGARIVQSWADPELAHAAADVIAKVGAVLPASERRHIESLTLWAPSDHQAAPVTIDQAALRRAVRDRRRVRFRYRDEAGRESDRQVRPLVMAFYGPVWVLAAWCETRRDFRVFRLDRMSSLVVLDATFPDEAGKTVMDFVRAEGRRRGRSMARPASGTTSAS
jgi:predicted DNA-binding transcriptional regulator YafY